MESNNKKNPRAGNQGGGKSSTNKFSHPSYKKASPPNSVAVVGWMNDFLALGGVLGISQDVYAEIVQAVCDHFGSTNANNYLVARLYKFAVEHRGFPAKKIPAFAVHILDREVLSYE
jgi:hypothetical protein